MPSKPCRGAPPGRRSSFLSDGACAGKTLLLAPLRALYRFQSRLRRQDGFRVESLAESGTCGSVKSGSVMTPRGLAHKEKGRAAIVATLGEICDGGQGRACNKRCYHGNSHRWTPAVWLQGPNGLPSMKFLFSGRLAITLGRKRRSLGKWG